MTTGKHSELQTRQHSDGTFELVVAPSEPVDEWSTSTALPLAEKSPRVIPWKSIAGVAAAAAVVGLGVIGVNNLDGGVVIEPEPLPVVSGFRPYSEGASAPMANMKAARSTSRRPAPAEAEEWADEEPERNVVVEHGEPAAEETVADSVEQQADRVEAPTKDEEIVDVEQLPDEVTTEEEAVIEGSHGIEPRAAGIEDNPALRRDMAKTLRNLNAERQLPALSQDFDHVGVERLQGGTANADTLNADTLGEEIVDDGEQESTE